MRDGSCAVKTISDGMKYITNKFESNKKFTRISNDNNLVKTWKNILKLKFKLKIILIY